LKQERAGRPRSCARERVQSREVQVLFRYTYSGLLTDHNCVTVS
jgi:hypothetical protein